MDLKLFATVFTTVFIAEIADKTQIATMLYASNTEHSRITVFFGSAIALCLASALAVFVGSALSHLINGKLLARLAGAAFILVGFWTLFRA
jgi:putative Ca2+/H+ antiporter (TMEM165/GDT1 family)